MNNKIPSITGLVTIAKLTPVENKISDISNLVKKTNKQKTKKKQIMKQKYEILEVIIL